MPKKSEALIAAEARIEKLEEDIKLVMEQENNSLLKQQKYYETHLRQTEFLLEIIRDKAPVSQFLKDECGRLIAESIKLRP